MNQLPDYIAIFIALAAFSVSLFNYLFDRRYDFYQRLQRMWLRTANDGPLDVVDLIPIADEAAFLFGKDIVAHVFSFEGHLHSGMPVFPDETFIAPFRKYLTLGR